ncbi:MAG: hypothetical protein HY823_01395 [Acidobacteria bacterium]|nr:hypothetical protein [Acidobacteriota bacterium]
MKQIGCGALLLLLALLTLWADSDQRPVQDSAGILLVLGIPATWLIYFGWRSRWGEDHPWRMPLRHLLTAGTIAPFAVLLTYVTCESFRADAVLEPMVKGTKAPQAMEAELLRYAASGWRRGDTVVRCLIQASVPGSEPLVIAVLRQAKGEEQKGIALLMLRSGNSALVEAATSWASGAGYSVVGKTARGPRWTPKDKR